ncbi:tRNA epoxyqueuosine(34) reductase QueG [Halorhodospira abdelmalekii]|nr:tRNA epoxyqueuosine(34) reductase QueG [Halorhodospira abdelmalekii]
MPYADRSIIPSPPRPAALGAANSDSSIEPAPHPQVAALRTWARELGFADCRVTHAGALEHDEAHLMRWLQAGRHAEMHFMARHGRKRVRPQVLFPGARSVIVVRLDYHPNHAADALRVLATGERGYVARYALGRDYHKLMRKRLAELGSRLAAAHPGIRYRPFVDSAPLLERALACRAGIGWIGKHTQLLCRQAGSYTLLGELITDLALPVDHPHAAGACGSCRACLKACPSGALTGPYQLDARRCIAYLTVEHPGSIPLALRPTVGNRIFGCDACQLACPWNRTADTTQTADFEPRHGLDAPQLAILLGWDETHFQRQTAGMAIRRLGHERWLRNVAVALGNSPPSQRAQAALERRLTHPSALVREHVSWALARQQRPTPRSTLA